MPTLSKLSKEYTSVNWALVYTLEAHAIDEWPISSSRYNPTGEPVSILQHQTKEDRLAAAREFRAVFKVPFPVVADTPDDGFEKVFSTWPFRFYILHRRKVTWRAMPRKCTYSVEELVSHLERLSS